MKSHIIIQGEEYNITPPLLHFLDQPPVFKVCFQVREIKKYTIEKIKLINSNAYPMIKTNVIDHIHQGLFVYLFFPQIFGMYKYFLSILLCQKEISN